MNLAKILYELPEEALVTEEDESLLNQIVSITKTSQFSQLDLSEEKLDELVSCLKNQENFSKEIDSISEGLERAASIILTEDKDDEDMYI